MSLNFKILQNRFFRSDESGESCVNNFSETEQQLSDKRYTVRFARDYKELEDIQKLRFEVFNLELKEGLEASYELERDQDRFDFSCQHLMVIDKKHDEVIGTYRMQTYESAFLSNGFYSATEFDLSSLPQKIITNSVETGRACIAKKHRNGRILFLLWRGLAFYMSLFQKRYLFGCCSLTSQDPVEGQRVMQYLVKKKYVLDDIMVSAHTGFHCNKVNLNDTAYLSVKLPRLFRLYLDYGAKVCSLPAIDKRFKTIDYLVIMDTEKLAQKTYKMFFS